MRKSSITARDGRTLTVFVPQPDDDSGAVAAWYLDGEVISRDEAQAFIDSYWDRTAPV